MPGCAAFFVVLLLGVSARAQLSPGALSHAHRSVSGPTQCASCHKFETGPASFRCLECHTEIARRLNAGRGLHAAQINKSHPDQDCARCHSEHKGEETQLIRWEPSQQEFDHAKTGFTLEGKHHEQACNKCHTAEHILEAERPSIRMKDLNRSFLGQPTECASCHKDIHGGQLGKDCRRCHTPLGWKTDLRFNHATAKFQLKGAHTKVECAKCHPRPANPAVPIKFSGLAFGRCADCHKDQHRGAFSKPCESCHNPGGWKQQVAIEGNFNHAKARFVLAGKHLQVNCEKCHAAADFKKPVPHQRCTDCHKDEHQGQFLRRADKGECSSCHTVEGYKPVRFVVADHARTAYPLEGRHAALPCAKCHVPAGKATLYRLKHAACPDCHADKHQGQFAAPPYEKRCDSCHTLKGFQSSTFTLARHQKVPFVLAGSHLAIPCIDCHKVIPESRPPLRRYRFEDRTCAGCHGDPHRGQFAERMGRLLPDGRPAGCETCHTPQSWKELARFDHSKTDFPLVGTHRAVPCMDCHRPPNLGMKLKDAVFKNTPKNCTNCHTEPHGGQFAVQGQTPPCTDCHNTSKWKPSLFDHARRAGFPLEGGHKAARCTACHKNTKMVADKTVLVYKPTPRKCVECHGATVTDTGS